MKIQSDGAYLSPETEVSYLTVSSVLCSSPEGGMEGYGDDIDVE